MGSGQGSLKRLTSVSSLGLPRGLEHLYVSLFIWGGGVNLTPVLQIPCKIIIPLQNAPQHKESLQGQADLGQMRTPGPNLRPHHIYTATQPWT